MRSMYSAPVRLAVLGCCLALAFALGGFVVNGAGLAQGKSAPVTVAPEKVAGLASLETGFVAIAEKVAPSVVSIHVRRTVQQGQGDMPDMGDLFAPFGGQGRAPRMQRPRKVEGSGSGVIVRSDGWIVTNDHVVDSADKVTVKLADGREFEGTVRRDYRSDISLVKINATGLPVLGFAESDKVRVGQWSIAFGSPFALENTMTVGIVSAKGRQETIAEGGDARFYPELIQSDAAINPGNSGGPLVDIHGHIIGINVAINSPSGGSVGLGFAIPARTVQSVMEQLISKGKVVRGYLGVVPRALTPDDRKRYGVESGGALLEQVQDGTPAAKAGVDVEDVVVKLNGAPVQDDVDFRARVASAAPGDKIDLVVRRDGKEKSITVTLEAAPDLTAPQAEAPKSGTDKLGLRVEPVSADTVKKYNLGALKQGVVVVEVASGEAADEAGIQPGDVILRANGDRVNSADELAKRVGGAKTGERVSLVILRGKAQTLVNVTIP